MKKFALYFLTVAMLFCCVAGCNKTDSSSSSSGGGDPKPVPAVLLNKDEYSLGAGVNKQLEYRLENAENATFSSENTNVVTVSGNGVITGVAEGQTKVTVRAVSAYDKKTEVTASAVVYVTPSGYSSLKGDEIGIKWLGRTFNYENAINCYNTASGFEVRFYGTKVTAQIVSAGKKTPQITVMTDGETAENGRVIDLSKEKGESEYTLAENLAEGEHVVRVYKITEAYTTSMGVKKINTDGYLMNISDGEKLKIEVYGDSITTGHNNLRETAAEAAESADKLQNGCLTYAFLTAESLNADINVIARVGIGMYSAWGNSFVFKDNWKKTYLSENDYLYGGVNPDWDFAKYTPDLVIINIGTNDVWYDWQTSQYKADLKQVCEQLFALYGENVKIVIAGGMMNSDYLSVAKAVARSYPEDSVTTAELPRSAANHPRVADNKAAAQTLTAFLNRFLFSE